MSCFYVKLQTKQGILGFNNIHRMLSRDIDEFLGRHLACKTFKNVSDKDMYAVGAYRDPKGLLLINVDIAKIIVAINARSDRSHLIVTDLKFSHNNQLCTLILEHID